MADISYGGSGGSGGGYFPPSFNPTGSGGGSIPSYTPPPAGGRPIVNQAISGVSLDPAYTDDYFKEHFNQANPYTQYTDVERFLISNTDILSIQNSGNRYEIIGYKTYNLYGSTWSNPYPIYRVYSNAYVDFENKATDAQNTYLQQQTDANNAATDAGQDLYIKSFGNIKNPSIKSDIATLSQLKELYSQLKFQQDITQYLNRVPDVNNINQMLDLENQIKNIESNLSKDLTDYWRQQEIIRKKEREFFGGFGLGNLSVLFDSGGGGGSWQLYQQYLQQEQFLANNNSMISDGSIYDWMAGGVYLNAVMAGGDLCAPYMPNDYYSVGLQYQVVGTNLNEGSKILDPYGSMAGSSSFGLNSSSRAAYQVLEL